MKSQICKFKDNLSELSFSLSLNSEKHEIQNVIFDLSSKVTIESLQIGHVNENAIFDLLSKVANESLLLNDK